jgi:hypothetical protein
MNPKRIGSIVYAFCAYSSELGHGISIDKVPDSLESAVEKLTAKIKLIPSAEARSVLTNKLNELAR